MNTDTHGSFLKEGTDGKTVLWLSRTPVYKADSYRPAIPEIPPSPPFSKGGLGGFQRSVFHQNMPIKIQRLCKRVVQINTDFIFKKIEDKTPNGTRMNTDTHGSVAETKAEGVRNER
jgi:hypothetical protein